MLSALAVSIAVSVGQGPVNPSPVPLPNAAPYNAYMLQVPPAMSLPAGINPAPAQRSVTSIDATPVSPGFVAVQPGKLPPLTPEIVPPPKKDETPPEPKEEKPKKDDNPHGYAAWLKPDPSKTGFFHRLYKVYYDEWFPDPNKEEEPEPEERPRGANPSPWQSPPFPNNEYQGYPLIGVPYNDSVPPVMQAIYGAQTPLSEKIKDSRIMFSGWATGFGVGSNAKNSNVPASYWITPNTVGIDQLVFKFERTADTVQTDHVDWGFRSIALYGIDYRYTTAGGWGSNQLLKHNLLEGWDPVEQYGELYVPGFLGGTMFRVGRWIACPDIESQYSIDNYLGSHSILFTYDTYTDTGIMVTQQINQQWIVQGVLHSGTDMAPWYPGAIPTFACGIRWVSEDNNDAIYAWANALNDAQFRHFEQYGQPLGHDNFNYIVSTWEHRFTEAVFTKTEAYYMWQYNAEVGGTPSAGPVQPYGGGGGNGVLLPGLSLAYGVLNYTMFGLTDRDYATIRNEWYDDERGMRTGVAGSYTSHTIGWSHQFNDVFMVRPEIGYYRNWSNPAFDDGTKHGDWIYGFDMTYRF